MVVVPTLLCLAALPSGTTECQLDKFAVEWPEMMAQFWTSPGYREVLKAYEPYALIGIANEWNGEDLVDAGPGDTVFRDGYTRAITELRKQRRQQHAGGHRQRLRSGLRLVARKCGLPQRFRPATQHHLRRQHLHVPDRGHGHGRHPRDRR